jgi:predicted nucleic acid-binding protein
VLTGDIVLLPELFERMLAPQTMHDELAHHEAPAMVRAWIAQAPAWLDVQADRAADASDDRTVPTLDQGERAVIALARAVRADLVLMDDPDGVTVARQQGLAVTGTLGVLDLAARRGLVILAAVFRTPEADELLSSARLARCPAGAA